MKYKNFKFQIKALSEEGEFEGYASVFNVKDMQNEIVEKGAFARTLSHKGNEVPLLWQHKVDEPIGIAYVEETDTGLYCKGKLLLTVNKAKDAYELIKNGVIKGMSIGYDVIKDKWENGIRYLKEIRLWEVSLTAFPANPEAQIVAVKGATTFHDLPLASEDRAWDADAAVARVRRWAGGPEKENMDWGKYAKAFFWYDEEDKENFGAYKLPFADVIDGELKAVPRGIFAAAAAIQGARGGVDIPSEDVPKVKAHIEKYYKKMDREPPWSKSLEDLNLELAVYDVKSFSDYIAENVKIGRVLSRANKELLKQAISALQSILDAAKDEEDEETSVEEQEIVNTLKAINDFLQKRKSS